MSSFESLGILGKTILYMTIIAEDSFLFIELQLQKGRTSMGTPPILLGSVGVVRERKRSMSVGCKS